MAFSSIKLIFYCVFAALAFATLTCSVSAQRRDYVSDHEIEIIRDAQYIDERISALTQMIDRRFTALGIEVNGWKDSEKTSEKWGDPPKGTRIDLLSDIKKILQKAVDDIDNLAANPDSAPIREKGDSRAKKDPDRIYIAIRALASSSKRYLPPLKMALEKTDVEIEKGPILDSIELCNQIIDAAESIPPIPAKPKS